MIARLLAWLGTFLGLFVGTAMIQAAFFNEAGAPLWGRLFQGVTGCWLVWVLGSALLGSLKKHVRRMRSTAAKDQIKA